MNKPVIAIGLDAAEPTLIEQWMSQGALPTLSRIREQGTYARLQNFDYYRAETPWTTFLTGCSPKQTGYWSPISFHPNTYEAELVEAYDFAEYQPFYALGEDYRVAVFDIPQSTLSQQVNGIQVLAWGAHSPQTPSHSLPASLFEEIVNKHGVHPGLHKDHVGCYDLDAITRLEDILKTGISRRGAICQELLQQEPWDLFLTIFGETHAAGHFMWHLGQRNHPLYEALGSRASKDSMLEVFKAIDQAIGEILTKAPSDAHIIVFSAHGMGVNVMDLPSGTFLPEFLYRFSFPGKFGLTSGELGTSPDSPITSLKKQSWSWETWSRKYETNPLKRFLRREAPYRVFKHIEPFLGTSEQPDLVSPHKLNEQKNPLSFQPAEWYKPCWKQMKAFALPSFSEGYIRINLQGRESQGIVPPSEYDHLCEEISQKLYRLQDARTGTPMVKKIIRTRQLPTDNHPKLPDADLVVIWQEEYASDVVDSPELGRIGPVPHFRSGSHRSQGFFLASGPAIEPNSSLAPGHSLDLTPTILSLMNAPIPEYFEGKTLLETGVLI
ncbi:MAG: nucleotide pyrophosphatase [Symploca sp. SIO3C6]|nr:nucleotide pyrophosphatase [Symploca sp. SIO3C6]NET06146.1 nucleotide pyrophosphatase [Symploca sp. SIO2B6]NET48020.1 nucleotide pyrophosphatase [Merismopedia sp. SIO2A8]